MDIRKKSLEKHYEWKGKIAVKATVPVKDMEALALAYTPGVAEPCLEIQRDEEKSYELTRRWNTVAVITDGTAILGLGDIGPVAGMPVMEGKALLFSEFAGIDAIPLCVGSKDVDEIVRTVQLISDSFGGINLEDISAPRCFEVERRLKEVCDIPVFHDDQHGTAIIAGAAVRNALRVVGKSLDSVRIVINGAGSAGIAIGRLLALAGARDIVYVDRAGAICAGDGALRGEHIRVAQESNPNRLRGSLADVIKGADVFIGVSAPNVLSGDMVRSMARDPVVFAMANPTPEIMPDEAKAAGAAVVGTGRSDFPNQINNVLAFPGVFRGALDCRARDINNEMKLAASEALIALVTDDELSADYILPTPFDPRVVPAVAAAVAEAARRCGIARK